MKITVEEQQRRSARARLKEYYARRSRKKREKIPKVKQAGFKNMRLVNKSISKAAEKDRPVKTAKKKVPKKMKKLPPGEARGARDLQRWAILRRG
jgi:hypothetical protein